MTRKSQFVAISKVQGLDIANILKSHLESEGIPVLLKYESAGLVYGITTDGIGAVTILVPQDLADEAKRIIEPQSSPESQD